MIEIVTDQDRNLKNIKQVGTPRGDNKIYIENNAYSKLKEKVYSDKRVFVLMGHTERMEGRYATFVEAAIQVKDIEFSGVVPRWNNSVWKDVFAEIKRLYEEMIIVGWAIDIKGLNPKVSPELERVHREYFGGVHQLLFLLDTLEQEEVFYVHKENKLISKDGFYIYHRARKSRKDLSVNEERRKEPEIKLDVEVPEERQKHRGVYRQMLQVQEKPKEIEGGNIGLAIAVAMLIFVVGVGIYENRGSIFAEKPAIEANIEQKEFSTETEIPVEIISGEETGE